MFGIRERICFELAKRLIKPPSGHDENHDAYEDWRNDELRGQWKYFSDDDIRGKDVVDFGCGYGNLSFILAELEPKQIAGVEIDAGFHAICVRHLAELEHPMASRIRFLMGTPGRMPLDDASYDTLLAFDCVEHVMEPEPIMREWRRVLRPGGKVLIWWSPFKSPYGPHLEAVVPIPWAHVIFGERAVLRTGARIYDLDTFVPRPWHFNEDGSRKQNPLAGLQSFEQQGYLNEMDAGGFHDVARRAGLEITRFDAHSFAGTAVRRAIGSTLVKVPVVGEYMTSFYIVECTRP